MPQSDNFSIDELAKIAEYYVSFDRSFNGLNTCSLLQKCAGIVSSEDSGLSQSCAQAAKTLEEGTKAIMDILSELYSQLNTYIRETRKNQTVTQESVESSKEQLDAASSAIAEIMGNKN